jgi:hypothetical protein
MQNSIASCVFVHSGMSNACFIFMACYMGPYVIVCVAEEPSLYFCLCTDEGMGYVTVLFQVDSKGF